MIIKSRMISTGRGEGVGAERDLDRKRDALKAEREKGDTCNPRSHPGER